MFSDDVSLVLLDLFMGLFLDIELPKLTAIVLADVSVNWVFL